MPKRILALLAATCLTLSACGGGSSPVPEPAPALPATEPATPPPPASPASLITDQRIIAMPASVAAPAPYPTKGSSITDPATGLVVTRVADKSELVGNSDNSPIRTTISAIVYSRYSPTNTTGEYVLAHGDNSTSAWIYRLSDNKMMTLVRFRPSLGNASVSLGELNELRWDYSGQHSNRLYFVGNNLISQSQRIGSENVAMSFYYIEFNPSSGTLSDPVLVHDFSAEFPAARYPNASILNDVEGDSSNDSRYWAWQVRDGSKLYAIATYDKSNSAILGTLQRSCSDVTLPCQVVNTPATASPYITKPNMVEMSPLGTRVIVHWYSATGGFGSPADLNSTADGPKAFLPNFSDVSSPVRIATDSLHSGWAWSRTGSELFVSQNSTNDWIEAVDITSVATANCVPIPKGYSCGTKLVSQPTLAPDFTVGFHFGKVYDRNKRGYAFVSTYDGSNNAWGKNQELLVAVRDGTAAAGPYVVRLGSNYNAYYDYRSEGAAALGYDGLSIWATANWGWTDGRGDVMRVQLPANFWSVLPAQ